MGYIGFNYDVMMRKFLYNNNNKENISISQRIKPNLRAVDVVCLCGNNINNNI